MTLISQLTVIARDTHAPSTSSTAHVTIHVTDRNDNAPLFTFPTPANYTLHISNAVPVGYVIGTVLARDRDAGENGRVSYAIHHDEGDDVLWIFNIDPELGSIHVGDSLVAVDYHVFSFSILARDYGQQPMLTSADLRVVVNRTIPFNINNNGGGSDGSAFSSPSQHNSLLVLSMSNPLVFVALAVGAGSLVVVLSMLVALVVVRRREGRRQMAAGVKSERMHGVINELLLAINCNSGKRAPHDVTTTSPPPPLHSLDGQNGHAVYIPNTTTVSTPPPSNGEEKEEGERQVSFAFLFACKT